MAADPFWDFSLALYGKPGVAPALLGLQDRHGLDVNLLLYACWAASQGRLLSSAEIGAVDALAAPWQAEIVRPLRALRRRLKGGFPGLAVEGVEAWRKRLGELEIEAERIAQEAMAAALPATPNSVAPGAATAANLKACLTHAGIAIDPATAADLAAILRACVPDADLAELEFGS